MTIIIIFIIIIVIQVQVMRVVLWIVDCGFRGVGCSGWD